MDIGKRYALENRGADNNENNVTSNNSKEQSQKGFEDEKNEIRKLPLTQDDRFEIVYEEGQGQQGYIPTEELKIEQNRTYTVTGFYHKLGIEPYQAPGYTAITTSDLNATDQSGTYFLKFNNPKDVYKFVGQHDLMDKAESNNELLRYYGISTNDNYTAMLGGLTAIFLTIIILGSIVLINNAFTISLAERTKQFGLLSSIGASRKQLRSMILTEALFISFIGIPLGVLGGLLGIKITLLGIDNLIADSLAMSTHVKVPFALVLSSKAILSAVAIALFTVLISAWIPAKRASRVTAIEAIRQTQDVVAKPVKVSKLTYKIFNLPGFLATKYYKRSSKKYRSTIVSLALSIVLFLSAYTFTTLMSSSIGGTHNTESSDFEYRFYFEDKDYSIDKIKKEIKSLSGVTDVSYTTKNFFNYLIPTDLVTKEGKTYYDDAKAMTDAIFKMQDQNKEKYYTNFDTVFVEDHNFATMLEQFNLSLEDYLKLDGNYPLVKNLRSYQDYSQRKFVKYDTFKQNTDAVIELINLKEMPDYYLKEVLPEVAEDGTSQLIFTNYQENKDKQISLNDAVAEKKDIHLKYFIEELPGYLKNNTSTTLFYPMSKISEFVKDEGKKDEGKAEYLFYINSDNNQQTENDLSQYNAKQASRGNYVNHVANRQQNKNLVTIVNVFCYGFITLISLIALTNVFNTITTNINLRTRDFAMLKSVGLSGKGLHKMMMFECFLYGTRALFWGLPLGLGISLLIYKTIDKGFEQAYRLPWLAILIVAVAIFLFVAMSMIFALHQVNKKNIIDSLKNENN